MPYPPRWQFASNRPEFSLLRTKASKKEKRLTEGTTAAENKITENKSEEEGGKRSGIECNKNS
ncbi:hypothetical protein JCM10003_95 [Bacteroides pyogenes JCM 10003]|nr:hypothetical protein JCM10003_95 [Bacteroides pyogenes JCM 10003]